MGRLDFSQADREKILHKNAETLPKTRVLSNLSAGSVTTRVLRPTASFSSGETALLPSKAECR